MKHEVYLINKDSGKAMKISTPKIDGLPTVNQEVSNETLNSPQQYSFDIAVKSNINEDVFKAIRDDMTKGIIQKFKELDLCIEYALRNKIDKPIKGEITKGKLKWRGIKLECCRIYESIGYVLLQRGKVIPFDFISDRQFQIWRLSKLIEEMQQELNQKPIDENSKDYQELEEMENEFAELLASEISQEFNTAKVSKEEFVQMIEEKLKF